MKKDADADVHALFAFVQVVELGSLAKTSPTGVCRLEFVGWMFPFLF